MRNKIAVILLVLVLASLSHAESYGLFYDFSGAFRNFTMGVSFGVGPSGLIGEEDVYDANWSSWDFNVSFNAAFPLAKEVVLVASVGFSIWNFRSEYDYLHRTVNDFVYVRSLEFSMLLDAFTTEHFFIGIGPNIRIPFIQESVLFDGRSTFSGSPDYARNLWLNVDVTLGVKYGTVELGLKSGYEVLGFYKETQKFKKLDMHEFRAILYLSYWFGYWINDNR